MPEKPKLTEINKPIIQRIVSNGRITIPSEIREIYNLQDGDLMEVLIIGFYKNNGGVKKDGEGDRKTRKTGRV